MSCTWQSINDEYYLVISDLFPSNLSANTNLTLVLESFRNPSSTQPYTVKAALGSQSDFFQYSITVNTPATATLILSTFSSLTGTQSSSIIKFNGNLYIDSNTIFGVSYSNVSLSYNGNTSNPI